MVLPILMVSLAATISGPLPEPEETKPYVVVYPVQDLLVSLPDFTDAPELNFQSAMAGQGNLFRERRRRGTRVPKTDPKELIRLIEAVIEPEAWGDTATIDYFNGCLVVTAPKRIHEMLD